MNFLQKTINNLKKLKNHFATTSGAMQKHEYEQELAQLERDLEVISDQNVIDDLIEEEGFKNTVSQYRDLHKYYQDYYKFIIKEILQDPSASARLKNYARQVQLRYDKTWQGIVRYLAQRKSRFVYGESYYNDVSEFIQEDSTVKTYTANSFANEPLPWLRKEDINEVDHFDEGLFGATAGAATGVVLAMTVSSLSAAFHLHPKLITGISATLGAWIGHFIQKHFFIDFTNYIKLKRYIEYHPEAYEMILDLMERNAEKFRQKDPAKYKKILENLKRLKKNPPGEFRNYLDDELDAEDSANDDPDLFTVRDVRSGQVVKGNSSSGGYKSKRNKRDYDIKDLQDVTQEEVADALKDMGL